MHICAIIPTYRHTSELPRLTHSLRPHCATIFIVDDGNVGPDHDRIAALHASHNGVEVLRLAVNGGKGAAVQRGFREAIARGFTHALQIDADGQHDVNDVVRFIDAARRHPAALICGQAIFDESAPKTRKYGRYLTHVSVWLETMSFAIADSMCGFRIYPLEAVRDVLGTTGLGARMDFDTEVAVRLHWHGTDVINIPTHVLYPKANASNFRMLRDNVLISAMHTRLIAQMPYRLARKHINRSIK